MGAKSESPGLTLPVESNSVDPGLCGSVVLEPSPGKQPSPDITCEKPPDVPSAGEGGHVQGCRAAWLCHLFAMWLLGVASPLGWLSPNCGVRGRPLSPVIPRCHQ